MSKVFYQVLSTGSMRAEHLHVGMLCSKRGALVGVAFGHRGYMANSRNMAIQAFLKTDADVLIQCDEDVIPPLNILNLAAHGKSLIGTIALHASNTGPSVNSAPLPGDGPTFPMERGDSPLRKVAWFGTGCYSITRQLAEDMIAAYGAMFHQENTKDGLRAAGVDVVMCRRARMIGHDAWIDRSMVCGQGGGGSIGWHVSHLHQVGCGFGSERLSAARVAVSTDGASARFARAQRALRSA